MANQPLLNPALLAAALEGLEAQKARLEEQINQVRSLMGRRGPGRPKKNATSAVFTASAPAPAADAPAAAPRAAGGKKSRKMSAAGRKRIAEAQKRRWDAFRAQKEGQE
ncbi:MAG: hypothetical protein U0Q16_18435 [Bryobacteraceae bacterium]